MNYKHFLFSLGLLALGAPLAAAVAPSLPASAGDKVESITVTGQRSVDAEKILAVLRQRVGEPLNPTVANQDVKRLWDMGLFQDVEVDSHPSADGQGVDLEYRVAERPVIQDVRFFGNKDESDGTLKDKSGLDTGQTFDQDKVAAAVRAIEKLYKDKNYYAVQVSVDTKPGTEAGKVVVNFLVSEGNQMKIEKIRVVGNKVFSASRIKGAMEDTEEAGWISGGSYDPDKVLADYERVLKMYASEGYVKAKLDGVDLDEWGDKGKQVVRDSTTFDEANKRIVLTLKVDEGIKYHLGSVTITGAKLIPDAEIRGMLSSLKAPVFNQEDWDADLARVRSAYNAKGYIYASVTPDYHWNNGTGQVDVNLSVSEGSKAYIEEIRIRGNEVTKDKVIRRQLDIKPGDPFDIDAVNRNRLRIMNLGFFDNVAYDVQPGSEMDKLILIYDVSPERKTGTLSLGAGYSSVEQLVGFLQVSQNNLFGNGQAVSLQWNFGTTTQSYSLSFTEPWFMDKPISLGVDIFNTTQSNLYASQGFNLQSEGAGLRLGYTLSEYWKVNVGYKYQTDDISSSTVVGILNGLSHISSITPSISRDTRDNIFDPTNGTYNVASLMLAGGLLGGDKSFYEPVVDSRAFFQTPAVFGQTWMKAFVLGLHSRFGWAIPYDAGTGDGLAAGVSSTAIPTSQLFFLGGTDTVRGFEERLLGASADGGGRMSMLGNVEYGFKPAPPVKLRVFYDIGNVFSDANWVGNSTPFMYSSYGIGMLFTIPTSVIQIRLDVGFPIQTEPVTVPGATPGTFTTIDPTGGQGYRVHFNIGNIF